MPDPSLAAMIQMCDLDAACRITTTIQFDEQGGEIEQEIVLVTVEKDK